MVQISTANARYAEYNEDIETQPKISACEELNGEFDYNKTPMSFLGTQTLAYNAPEA